MESSRHTSNSVAIWQLAMIKFLQFSLSDTRSTAQHRVSRFDLRHPPISNPAQGGYGSKVIQYKKLLEIFLSMLMPHWHWPHGGTFTGNRPDQCVSVISGTYGGIRQGQRHIFLVSHSIVSWSVFA
jgi:hypothetical protein